MPFCTFCGHDNLSIWSPYRTRYMLLRGILNLKSGAPRHPPPPRLLSNQIPIRREVIGRT
jgi:hypothetical protein